ncbi:hypothetical protein GCM10017161_41850 [Thalassotalea marina]|uniref:Uncharacterized protein n=1 Tax=Thalassotalea marina TaxID=1673741 RepID=A0A919EPV0_9GAMM|nr:hypothetical protein GCM10017161_41850 [Thalassotalea marina]
MGMPSFLAIGHMAIIQPSLLLSTTTGLNLIDGSYIFSIDAKQPVASVKLNISINKGRKV